MIEKSAILHYFRTSVPQTISEKDLIERLHIDSDHRHELKKALRELIAAGDIIDVKKHKFGLPDALHLIVGHVQANRKGFAFVISKQKDRPDIFISPGDLHNALHGDLVVAQMHRKHSGKRDAGEILRILQHGERRVIGTYQVHGNHGMVLPESGKIPYDIYIAEENASQAVHGQIVVAQILRFNENHRHPDGEIVEVLGFPQAVGMDEKIVIASHGLPTEFPAEVLETANALCDQISEEELAGRLDLRGQRTFTIDGEQARDFDDAVSIERLENGNYRLGVHIADVDFYVRENSVLDQEAYKRGTSVYFPDRSIPMFPERLSSNLCSLREGEDRLTNSVVIDFDPTGKQIRYDIRPSVIRSKQRFTYTLVRRILKEQDEALREQYQDFLPSLSLMKDLSELLLQKRMQRGSLDFDLPEPQLVLDLQGSVENIVKAERNLAHRMIEEFMIAANETVASHLTWMQIPMMYRTHETPDDAKVESVNDFLGSLGLRLQRSKQIHPKDFQKLLTQVRNKPIEHLVNILALRSMKQARYTVDNLGHFGLASSCYMHFTSPIRRYPDLMVHRILKDAWEGKAFSEQAVERRQEQLETIAEHSSLRERVAVEAEREILLVKKLRFMQGKLGEVFDGVISGVTTFGLFIELREYFVEGLVHVTQLHDDRYQYREETYSLVGEHTHNTYQIGDSVRVQVARVDLPKRQIDFQLL